jgi:hypothetical protein
VVVEFFHILGGRGRSSDGRVRMSDEELLSLVIDRRRVEIPRESLLHNGLIRPQLERDFTYVT